LPFTFGRLEILLGKSDDQRDLPKDFKDALKRLKDRGYLQGSEDQ